MTVPYLSEDSILAWEKETTRGTAPSTGSAWRSFGLVTEYQDLGPTWSILREFMINAGQEPNALQTQGRAYGPLTMGPYQIRDPLILGYAFGKETNRAQIGTSGYYRHTIEPTDAGELPSKSVAMRDTKNDGSGDDHSLIFLETIMPRLSLRGEAVNDDGSGGRALMAPDLMAHDHTTTNASNVTVNLTQTEPYKFTHGNVTLEGTRIARVREFEYTLDRRARYAYYWRDDADDAPHEAPPEGAMHDLNLNVIADGNTFTVDGTPYTLRELNRNEITFDVTLSFTRTTDQDEFDLEFTDVLLSEAPGQRGQGKVVIPARGMVKACDFKYVDQNDSAHFPT